MALHVRTQHAFNLFNTSPGYEFLGAGVFYGDGDVNTKSGRYTDVSIDAWVQQGAAANKFVFVLDYRVHEDSADYTKLQIRETHEFEVPSLAANVNIGRAGAMNAHYLSRVKGKSHNWINITGAPGLSGSYLSECWRKIDGPGDDVKNRNVGILARVVIPIEYDLPLSRMKEISFEIEGKRHALVDIGKYRKWDGDDYRDAERDPIPADLEKLLKAAGSPLA